MAPKKDPIRLDTVTMMVRKPMKGEELEEALKNYLATLKELNRLEKGLAESKAAFKKDIDDVNARLDEQTTALDLGELKETEVEVATFAGGRKTYKDKETGELIEDSRIPEQLEINTEEEDTDGPGE